MPDQFPPAGTECQDCGCCLAAVFAGNVPVCWECDLGQPCKGKQAGKAAASPEVPVPARRALFGRFQTRQVKALGPAAAKPKPSGKGYPLPAETKAAILAADPTLSHSTLGHRFGCSDVTVAKVRRQAGIPTPPSIFNPRKAAPMPSTDQPAIEGLREQYDRDEPEESRVDIPQSAPSASAPSPYCDAVGTLRLADHYAAVISDLEEKAVSLAGDLETITRVLLPSLRAMRTRSLNPPSTVTEPAPPEAVHV